MKQNILFLIILLLVSCFCTGCCKTGELIVLPSSTEIQCIKIETLDSTEVTYTDAEKIEYFISILSEATTTNKSSVQDFPMVDEYGTINILTDNHNLTIYYYEDNEKYYLEQPYQGIYKLETNINELIANND